ncbi:type II secretion system F family protein [Pyrofollis japonicus]|uniref:type II secretion system F family protein n=1 Tax=Pyrofollis japonicus TaxID=3060460 RepID=UPI00295B8AB7|nr:type II secretion system F family protein [Pyrofollis japonicus]
MSGEREITLKLLYLLLHMYTVSTGKPERRRLFELNTLVGGYGEYQSLLRRIAVIAVEWGYGFVRAIRIAAREVKNEYFRGFLIRLGEVLRTGEDVTRFLRVELATALRQYISSYSRSIDLLRIFLGLYATLMSASAFVILTFTLLALFVGKDVSIFIVSLAMIIITLSTFALVAKMIAPEDPLIYRSKEVLNPMILKLNRITQLSLAIAPLVGGIVYFITKDPLIVIPSLALPAMAPGIYAMRIENFVKKINNFNQVFVRSFGLTFSVLPNYAAALESILVADYGPLTPFLRRLHARITNGIDPHIAFRYFISETASMDVLNSSNIIVDTIDAGGDMAETGMVLSNTLIRLNDARRDRERLSRTFEVVVYLMQGLVAGIAAAIVNIITAFARFYSQLSQIVYSSPQVSQYLPIMPSLPPLNVLAWTIAIFLGSLILLNSIIIAYVRGSIFEISLLHAAVLATVTAIAVKIMQILAQSLIIPGLLPPITG